MNTKITYTERVGETLDAIPALSDSPSLFILADHNTTQIVLPRIGCETVRRAQTITIPAGEQSKNTDTLMTVWQALCDGEATRNSVLINVGGGMVTDLGGMAAATFKRGIRFINVPTTTLGAVDAAIGGKTGINFNGLKNEVGTFANPIEAIVSTIFFDTLPRKELLSGYAEVIKHGLLDNEETFNELATTPPSDMTLSQLRRSIEVKSRIVAQDPCESGLRRVLNLGHTVGHALESLLLQRGQPKPHGYAVAWGLVTETVLSHMIARFPAGDLYLLAQFVREHYNAPNITCDDYPTLLQLMRHDKKSRSGEINCTLLRRCGEPLVDNTVSDEQMTAALDILRDLMGI